MNSTARAITWNPRWKARASARRPAKPRSCSWKDWIAGVPGLTYGDIAVRPFRFEHDAITFGLIVEDGHGTDWAELYPDRLGFHAPWDGSYDT